MCPTEDKKRDTHTQLCTGVCHTYPQRIMSITKAEITHRNILYKFSHLKHIYPVHLMPKCVPWAGSQRERRERERQRKKKNYLNIDVCPLSTVGLAWNVQPGLPAAAAAVSLCARRACKFVQLDAKTSTWNAGRTNGHTLVHQFVATCGIFFFNFILFFCIQSQRGSAKRAVCEFWFIRQWQRHLYMQLLLYFRLGPTLNLQFSSFLSHEKCKCVLASK